MRGLRIATIGSITFVVTSFASGEDMGGLTIRDQVRAVQRLQDSSAHGVSTAIELRNVMIEQINRQYQAVPAEPGSANEVAVAVFSGASPKIAELALLSPEIPETARATLEAAIAYGTGKPETATLKLHDIDPRQLPASAGGQIALVKAILVTPSDPASAVALLHLAITLNPGGLIEEASLRRLVPLVAAAGNRADFLWAADRYLRRFPQSPFAAGYFGDLVEALVGLMGKDEAGLASIDLLFARLPTAPRRSLYLDLAKRATAHGKPEFAQFAARRARRLSLDGSAEWHLANLYDAAHSIVGSDYESSVARLKSINVELIDGESRQLLAESLALAAHIRSPQGPQQAHELPQGNAAELSPEDLALTKRAGSALRQANQILESLGQ